MAPTIATMFCASGTDEYNGAERVTRYTPAVTMVAAWIRALTGVGPAIASGSQTYNGSCADVPVAPTKRSNVIAVTVAGERCDAAAATSVKLSECIPGPRFQKSKKMPSKKPASPIRLTTKAFFPALALLSTGNQKPI